MNSTAGSPFGSTPFGNGADPVADSRHTAAAQRHRPRPSSLPVTLAWMLGALLLVVALGLGGALVVDANRDSTDADTAVAALWAGPVLG